MGFMSWIWESDQPVADPLKIRNVEVEPTKTSSL